MHPVARVLASFVMTITKKNEIDFFKTKEEALAWLIRLKRTIVTNSNFNNNDIVLQTKHRINQLVNVVMQVASGNYNAQVKLSGKNDDLDSLAMGLNMMIDDIKEQY